MVAAGGNRRAARCWMAVALLATAAGCAAGPDLDIDRVEPPRERVPVVLVPGLTGSELHETETGRIVWGKGKNLLRPRDGGYSVAVPLGQQAREDRRIEAGDPVFRIELLGVLRLQIYGPLWRTLESAGYRPGILTEPTADETLFAFPYDWRMGNETTVRSLESALQRLREVRGGTTLEVDLVGHSNAGRLLRWYVKYGAASLEDVESGRAQRPEGIRVRKLILIGADNGGSIDALRRLNRGRRYVPWIGRRFLPETLFTFESLIQTLPAPRADLFFDADGNPLEIDLYDVKNWTRYGWSVFAAETRARLERSSGEDGPFAGESARIEYLENALDRARRTHERLRLDGSGVGDTRYCVIRNVRKPTGYRAMLGEGQKGRWKTWFVEDARVRRDPDLRALATTEGDGYASIASQEALSPTERAAMSGRVYDVDAGHRELARHPDALRAILELLKAP